MDVVSNANSMIMGEVLSMRTGPGLRKVFEEAGWIQEWLAQGRDEARAEFSRERERSNREREQMRQENERLRREITVLKSAAHQKA
jgi:hypothetical protein